MDTEQIMSNDHTGDSAPAREANSESDSSAAMEGVSDYEEHIDEMKNKDRGELVNEVVADGQESTVENSEKTDPFWQSHPDLLEEAKQMNAPLTPGEFKSAGFWFKRDEDGKSHVVATSPEYREWQEGGKNGKQPKQYESLDDQRYRKQREEYFANLRNQLSANEEYDKRVEERAREQAAMMEEMQQKQQERERERIAKLERIQELKESGDVFSKEMVDLVCETEYPYGIYVNKKRDEEIRQKILSCLYETYPDEQELEKLVVNPTKIAYTEAFKEDKLVASESRVAEMVGERITWRDPDQLSRFKYGATRVWKQIMLMKAQQDTPVVMGEMADEDKAQIKHDAAYKALEDGKLFPKTFKEKPEAINAIMAELNIDKNDDGIIRLALYAYGEKHKAPEIKYFDLENKVAELINEGEESGLHCYRGRELSIEHPDNKGRLRALDPSVSKKAMAKIREATAALVERLGGDSRTGETIEIAKTRTVEKEKRKLSHMIAENLDFDYEHYLNTKTVSASAEDALQEYVQDTISKDPLGYFMYKDGIIESLGDMSDMETSIDYKESIRDVLLTMLERGWREDWKGRKQYDVARIFKTERFRENQGRLEINFNARKMFEPAFNGFLNTIKSRNGEKSEQADWYYENIFANDPGKFLAMLAAYRKSDECERGTKGKITEFFKHNSQAWEDKIRQDVEERFKKEIGDKHRAIETSVLRDASRGDIKKIIDAHKHEVVERAKARATREIETFVAPTTTSGEQEETGQEERKETPFDFGLEKAAALERWSDYIGANYPEANVQWFTDVFQQGDNDTKVFEDSRSYIGFSFEYEGKLCVIAESLHDTAAMYLWRGEIGEDFEELFDRSKPDARRAEDDPRIAFLNHIDKEHFDEDLDLAYKKALLFFRTGDKGIVDYKYFNGRNSAKANRDWHEYQELEFPAWPLGIDENGGTPEDIERYRAWQERQDLIRTRLTEALERGGQEEVEAEKRRIAEEEYDRIMNEAA